MTTTPLIISGITSYVIIKCPHEDHCHVHVCIEAPKRKRAVVVPMGIIFDTAEGAIHWLRTFDPFAVEQGGACHVLEDDAIRHIHFTPSPDTDDLDEAIHRSCLIH